MPNKYENRVRKVFDRIVTSSDAFLITNLKNIRYLTGFRGSFAIALLTGHGCYLFVDFRYLKQAQKEATGEILLFKKSWIDTLMSVIKERNIQRLSFEDTCSYEIFSMLERQKIELIPQKLQVETVRAVKDQEEIDSIKKAVDIAERAFLNIKHCIKANVSERAIAVALENELRLLGSESIPFSVIVASGKNSSMPHWNASDRVLKNGDFVIIDWGAGYDGYFSDMTRTFIIGAATEVQKNIYEIVKKANISAIQCCSAGVEAKTIDESARRLIEDAGYGENFGHATGHGVGLDVHELPKISSESEVKIDNGMVFTVEPGVYIEESGGVRIEDMVVIKENRAKILTDLPKDFEIL